MFLQIGNLNIGEQVQLSQFLDIGGIQIEGVLEVIGQIFEEVSVIKLLTLIERVSNLFDSLLNDRGFQFIDLGIHMERFR